MFVSEDVIFIKAVLAVVVLVSGLCVLIYVAYASYKCTKIVRRLWRKHEDMIYKEYIARLRHRDFDKFCEEVNKIRRKKGQQPIPKDVLKKVQYNLMYTIE